MIIQFHLHLLTNNQWLTDFSRYCTPTFTNVKIPFITINFAVLWNASFSKILCKFHWSNVFFFFHVSFLKIKTQYFSLLFLFLWFEWPTLFCRFYHECIFELLDWLIWFAHQFLLVYLKIHWRLILVMYYVVLHSDFE